MKQIQDFIPEEQHIPFSKEAALTLIALLRDVDVQNIFYYPVSTAQASSYYDIIHEPICIQEIEKKFRSYNYMDEFLYDCRLLYNNAILFNGENSPIAHTAFQFREIIDSFEDSFYLSSGLGAKTKIPKNDISVMIESLIDGKSDIRFSDLQDIVIRRFLDTPVMKKVLFEEDTIVKNEGVSAKDWLKFCEIPILRGPQGYKPEPIRSLVPSRFGSEDEDDVAE